MIEKWMPVTVDGKDWPYEILDGGEVRRSEPASGARVGHVLSPYMRPDGYLQVALNVCGKRHTYRVHRLVADVFLGPRPRGYYVNHKDGDKLNNWVRNLEYLTPLENSRHALANGFSFSHLTSTDVKDIRKIMTVLKEKYEITGGALGAIADRRNWKWVSEGHT